MKVSRGLFGAERSAATRLAASPAAEAAARAFARHETAPMMASAWKERQEWARSLAQGKADFYGRRLFDPEALKAARWVAKLARAARTMPTPKWVQGSDPRLPIKPAQMARLRTRLVIIYEALQ